MKIARFIVAVAFIASGSASAQIAVSANDGKQLQPWDDPPGVRPDSISILDISHYPPRLLASVAAPASMIGSPTAVAVARDSSFAIVTNSQKVDPANPGKLIANDEVTVVDLANPRDPKVTQILHAGPTVNGVSLNRAGTLALAASGGDDSITVFSVAHRRLAFVAKLILEAHANPADVVFSKDGRQAFALERGPSKIEILAVDGIKVSDTGKGIVTGRGPYGAVVTPDGKYLINTNTGGAIAPSAPPAGGGRSPRASSSLTMVDIATGQLVSSVNVGVTSEHVALSSNGKYAEVTLQNNSTVPPGDPNYNSRRGVISVLAVGQGSLQPVASADSCHWPQGATWSKDDKTILLDCAEEREIWVYRFDGKTLTQDPSATLKFYDRPGALATAYSR